MKFATQQAAGDLTLAAFAKYPCMHSVQLIVRGKITL